MNKERVLLIMLASLQFTNIIDFMIMMPLGKQIMELFRIETSQFGVVVASYTLSAWASGMVASLFLDKFDRKSSLLFTYSGFITGTFLCALAPNYELLVGARILTGIFGGILGAQVLAIVADTVPFERRGTAMGIIMAAFSLASALGVPIGIFIAKHWNWQMPFIVIGSLAFIIWIIAFFVLPSMRAHLQNVKKESPFLLYKTAFTNKYQRNGLLMMIIMMFGHFMIVPNVATYLQYNVEFSEESLMWVYLCGGIISIYSNPLAGRLADKHGKEKIFIVFVLLTTLPVFLITHLGVVPVYVAVGITTLFFAFSGGRFSPAQALISETVNPQHRGSFMSFVSAMQQLGAGLGALIAGIIMSTGPDKKIQGFNVVGYVAIGVTLCSLFFIHRIRPPKA
ncbi:MAG: MFS transporter [Flavobacteriales bacterium]|nr:MFS transporter [Flavobacteriales bacterium]